jgi:hypothetical protein
VICHLFAPSQQGAKSSRKNRQKATNDPFHTQVIHKTNSGGGLRMLPAPAGAVNLGNVSQRVYKHFHSNTLLATGGSTTVQPAKPEVPAWTLQLFMADQTMIYPQVVHNPLFKYPIVSLHSRSDKSRYTLI